MKKLFLVVASLMIGASAFASVPCPNASSRHAKTAYKKPAVTAQGAAGTQRTTQR